VIRLRGLPLSDTEAAQLVHRLRADEDSAGCDVADRLERALETGGGTVVTSSPQAQALLGVLLEWDDNGRLRELRTSLRQFLAGARIPSPGLTCTNCHRGPRPEENADDDWRAYSDGRGGLHVFCPECAAREFGSGSA
jgi:hypothetical protein